MRHTDRKEYGLFNTILVGGPGTAKTSNIIIYSLKFDPEEMLFKRINFSSATTPENYQEGIENELVNQTSKTSVPPGGK